MKATNNQLYYFWADVRPSPNSTYIEHNMGSVPGGDFGQQAFIEILRDSSSQYHAKIATPNFNQTGYSTSNTMNPDAIDMGEELTGSSGAYAP